MNDLAHDLSPESDSVLFEFTCPGPLDSLELERPRLLSWLSRWLGSRDEAEDVLQEAMIATWQNESRLDGPASARGWLRRAAHNAAVDSIRRRDARSRREREWTSLQMLEDSSVEAPRVSPAALAEAFAALPPPVLSLIVSVELKGASIAEVARREGSTSNSIRVRLHRARRQLRRCLLQGTGSADDASPAWQGAPSFASAKHFSGPPCNAGPIAAFSGC